MSAVTLPELRWLPTKNTSSRGGVHANLLVLHETAGSYASALSWLRNPASEASATLLLREDGKLCAQLVTLASKPWTQCATFNPRAISLELANLTSKGYHDEHQLQVAARIFAWLCHSQKIPARYARGGHGAGICRHLDLGAAGCGHLQCGPGYSDWLRFVRMVEQELERGGFRRAWAR